MAVLIYPGKYLEKKSLSSRCCQGPNAPLLSAKTRAGSRCSTPDQHRCCLGPLLSSSCGCEAAVTPISLTTDKVEPRWTRLLGVHMLLWKMFVQLFSSCLKLGHSVYVWICEFYYLFLCLSFPLVTFKISWGMGSALSPVSTTVLINTGCWVSILKV